MDQGVQELAPWEIPPDEAYWQALLQEGEYGEGALESPVDPGQNLAAGQATMPEQDMAGHSKELFSEPPEPEPTHWDTFSRYLHEERAIDLPVVGSNRGGLLVKWNGVMGFVPASQLCETPPYGDDELRRESLADRIGSTLALKVIEVDPSESRLILSERAARRIQEPDLSILDDLTPGDVCHGAITNLCPFGAFVDLGGVEGLIHISELSWGRVSHPSDVVQSGQEVEVYVLNIDRDQGRIGLSLKRLRPDPWQTVESRYQIGQEVEGIITNVVHFGAFVRIEDGLEGLIHTSELADSLGDPRHTFQEGQAIRVQIMSIEGARHRIGLAPT